MTDSQAGGTFQIEIKNAEPIAMPKVTCYGSFNKYFYILQ